MKILIVDDNVSKSSNIARVLKKLPEITDDSFKHVTNVHEAKQELTGNHFDLLILDVVLPNLPLGFAKPEFGLKLLSDVLSRSSSYVLPTHIIGITAYKELIESANRDFSSRLLSLSFYDETSDAWSRALLARTQHILSTLAGNANVERKYGCDLVVICALDDPELNAVTRLPWEWKQLSQVDDSTIYHTGHFLVGSRDIKVVAASADRMGMPAATVLTTKMVYEFRPRYLVMAGIAAGVPGKCNFGDVLIANAAFDHGSGKLRRSENGDSLEFSPSYHHVNVSPLLLGKLKLLVNDRSFADEIRRAWPGQQIDSLLSMKIGPLASGAAVHADGSTLETLLKRQRDLAGLDMESYGVMVACSDVSGPRPEAFIIKSVVDYADGGKSDDFQVYAAYTSAQALRIFCERFLFEGT